MGDQPADRDMAMGGPENRNSMITRRIIELCGYTDGCPGCEFIAGIRSRIAHNQVCRNRIESMKGQHREVDKALGKRDRRFGVDQEQDEDEEQDNPKAKKARVARVVESANGEQGWHTHGEV